MKGERFFIVCMIMAVGFAACRPSSQPNYRPMPSEYTTVYEERYGQCYDYIPAKVVALDLYSSGLSLNDEHRIEGTGHNLYLSDIFVPGDSLVPGTYRTADTGEPFTFLPGKDFEGKPHGIYLLKIEESKLQSIQVMDSGYMIVKDTTNGMLDLQFKFYYKGAYTSKATYQTHFQGVLDKKIWVNR